MPNSVAVIYPYIPHYRMPVFRELLNSDKFRNYEFFAGRNTIDETIKSEEADARSIFNKIRNLTLCGLTFQSGLFPICRSSEYRHIIFLGDPHFVTTWIYAALARMFGKKVWFWTHGWLRLESGPKGWLRKFFYKLPHGLLLYGERAKSIGVKSGFEPNRLHVIYNSLDYDQQRAVRERLHSGSLSESLSVKAPTWLRDQPYFACIARLTYLCRFDLAIEALSRLKIDNGIDIGMVFIGDGQQRDALQELAVRRGVRCWFTGAIYDEETIGRLLYNARAVVSPGKVGLTAMHSLAYGTPVISHNDFDKQMPEFEAIIPGKTGDFFAAGSAADLAMIMLRWINKARDEGEREACYARIEERYTPQRQHDFIEFALRTQE